MAKNTARFEDLFDSKTISARITVYAASVLDDALRALSMRKAIVNGQAMTREYLLSAIICHYGQMSYEEQKEALKEGIATMLSHARMVEDNDWELAGEPHRPKTTTPHVGDVRSANETKRGTGKRGGA